jgi:hypothetical protein
MTKFILQLTDGSGDSGYGVILNKEATRWDDNSSAANHHIANFTQAGNVRSPGGGLACKDNGLTVLMLEDATWNMIVDGQSHGAHRQFDSDSPVENNWKWKLLRIE